MPKLKQNDQQKLYSLLVAYINFGMKLHDVKVPEIALAARITPQSFYRKLRNPEEFRLGELTAVFKKLGLSFEGLQSMKGNFNG